MEKFSDTEEIHCRVSMAIRFQSGNDMEIGHGVMAGCPAFCAMFVRCSFLPSRRLTRIQLPGPGHPLAEPFDDGDSRFGDREE
jgi:hypothetical protein